MSTTMGRYTHKYFSSLLPELYITYQSGSAHLAISNEPGEPIKRTGNCAGTCASFCGLWPFVGVSPNPSRIPNRGIYKL